MFKKLMILIVSIFLSSICANCILLASNGTESVNSVIEPYQYRIVTLPFQGDIDNRSQDIARAISYPFQADLFVLKDVSVIHLRSKYEYYSFFDEQEIYNAAVGSGANYAIKGHVNVEADVIYLNFKIYDVNKKSLVGEVNKKGSIFSVEYLIDQSIFSIAEMLSLPVTNDEKILMKKRYTSFGMLYKFGDIMQYVLTGENIYKNKISYLNSLNLLVRKNHDPYIFQFLGSLSYMTTNRRIYCYKKAIEIREFFPEVYFDLNLLFIEKYPRPNQKAFDCAIELAKQAPRYGSGMVSVCSRYYDIKDYENAYKYGILAVKGAPKNSYTWINLILSAVKSLKLTEAEQFAKQFVTLCPDDPESYISYARVYTAGQKVGPAMDYYKRAISAGIQNNNITLINAVKVYYSIGVILSDLGKYEDAIKMYQKILEIAKCYRNVHHNMGKCFFRLKNYTEAEREFLREMFFYGPNENTLVALADVYKENKKYKKAENIYESLIKIKPKEGAYYNNAAWFELLSDFDLVKAEQLSQKALMYSSEREGWTYSTYGLILAFQDKLDEANSYAQKAIDVDDINGGYLVKIIVEYKKGNIQESMRLLSIFEKDLDVEDLYLYKKAINKK